MTHLFTSTSLQQLYQVCQCDQIILSLHNYILKMATYITGIYLEFLLDGPKAHPTKISWALTLAGGLGAARLPVGSMGNALVRVQGSEAPRPKLDLSILHVPRQPLLRPFFLVFHFNISTVLVYSRNIF